MTQNAKNHTKAFLRVIRTMGRYLPLFVFAAVLFPSYASGGEADEGSAYFEFVEYNGEITITGMQGNARTIVIPDRINDLPVTHIGNDAFAEAQLTGVTIPGSVTTIGHRAFLRNQLTEVIIPDSVTRIGNLVFSENQLISATIGDSVTDIGWSAFRHNQLRNVMLPHSVTRIGGNAFANNLLSGVIIPDSVTHIGNGAFTENQLNSVIIGNSVIDIGMIAFAENLLTNVVIPDSVRFICNRAFGENPLTTVTIGGILTMIEDGTGTGQQTTVILHDPDVDVAFSAFAPSFRILKSFTPPVFGYSGEVFGFRDNYFRSLAVINENTVRFYQLVWDDLAGREVWAQEATKFAFDLPDAYRSVFAFGGDLCVVVEGTAQFYRFQDNRWKVLPEKAFILPDGYTYVFAIDTSSRMISNDVFFILGVVVNSVIHFYQFDENQWKEMPDRTFNLLYGYDAIFGARHEFFGETISVLYENTIRFYRFNRWQHEEYEINMSPSWIEEPNMTFDLPEGYFHAFEFNGMLGIFSGNSTRSFHFSASSNRWFERAYDGK